MPSSDGSVLECGPAWYSEDPATEPFREASRDMVLAPGVGLPGRVWSSGRPAWHRDVARDESLPRSGIAGDVGIKAGLVIPVLADDEPVAVLEFYVREERDEDECLTDLVGAVAAQLGTVIRRRRIEEELRCSEARYRAIVDTAADAIITIAAGSTVRSFNRGAERIFGYAAPEVIGQPITMLMPERYRPLHTAGVRRYLQTGESRVLGRTVELVGLRKDGREFPLELSVTPVREEESVLFVGILRDITRRKRMELAMQRQTATLRNHAHLLDLTRDAVMVRDFHRGTISYWNEGAEVAFGWMKGETAGKVAHELLRAQLPLARDEIESRLVRDGRWEGEITYTRRDGTLVVMASRWALQRDDEGEPAAILEIDTDVTERKRLEAEREALLAAEREHSRRLTELASLKADFTAMVGHELSTPVAALRGLVAMLSSGKLGAERQPGVVDAMRAEIEVVSKLVSDVRAAAAVERTDFDVRPRAIPVAALLGDALSYARTLPGDRPVELVATTDDPVLADPDRIGQVLRNLLGNAAKYTPQGTRIELRARAGGRGVRIEVADQGPGIHPEDLSRIFEKFGRGGDAEGGKIPGVGLGLYLSRRIVRAHGGDLWVESRPGAGSVFGFELEVAR